MSSEESIDILLKATRLWKTYGENPTEKQYRDVVSLITLAIKKADEPLAIAHSMLAQIHFDMENYEAAWGAAEQTTLIDPDDFKSQLIKVFVSYAYASDAAESASAQRGGMLSAITSLFQARGYKDGYTAGKRLADALTGGMSAGKLKKLFNEELVKLIATFERKCAKGCLASEFLEFASRLTKLADGIYQTPKLVETHKNLYRLVAEAPIEKVECESEEERQNVEMAKLIAEGRTA